MSDADPTPSIDPRADAGPRRVHPLVWIALGGLLVLGTLISGSPRMAAPWIQGDEHRFIVNSPDVTGAGQTLPRWQQYLAIFTHYHDDLYQPVPMLSYALEWDLWGDARIANMRRTDVLLHALNGLLLWGALAALLRRLLPERAPGTIALATYGLALLWTLHPIQVSAYAADMGRTHILSAGFVLLALRAHLAYLDRPRWWWAAAMLLLLVLANMAKPVVGWVVVVFLLEVHAFGWRAAWRSWRVWSVAVLGIVFASLTLSATAEAAMLEELDPLMYGDRFSRSLFAVWLHVANTVLPVALSPWYLPDPRAVWSHPLVWVGLIISLASAAAFFAAVRRQRLFGLALGIAWFWVLLLPVLGLIGARVAAGNDRYVYQPLMGALLAIGVLVLAGKGSGARQRGLALAGLASVLALASVPLNRHLTWVARSTIDRAERIVALYPEHHRGLEILAIGNEFSADHDSFERRAVGPGELLRRAGATLDATVALADERPAYFASAEDRIRFERRMAHRYLLYGRSEESLRRADRAAQMEFDANPGAAEPLSLETLTVLAHAYRALGRWDLAAALYARLTPLLDERRHFDGLRLIEYADLLLHRLDRPTDAIAVYRRALAWPGLEPAAQLVATIGLGLAEVRGGEGQRGFELLAGVLNNPATAGESTALFAMGEFYLRSEQWENALRTYGRIALSDPTHFKALRGVHEAAVQMGRYDAALEFWTAAVEREPQSRAFRSYLAWTLACAGDPDAEPVAHLLWSDLDPGNAAAAWALSLRAAQQGDLADAVCHARDALTGAPVPDMALPRMAALEIERQIATGRAPALAEVVAAYAWLGSGEAEPAFAALRRARDALSAPAFERVAIDFAEHFGPEAVAPAEFSGVAGKSQDGY